jgi:hypothetical protein
VSDIARGVGFTTTGRIGISLNDALQPLQNEIDGDYDQHLYDILWLARFRLSLENTLCATFNFTFPRKGWKSDEVAEISLRVRAVAQKQVVLVGLLQDFSEVTEILTGENLCKPISPGCRYNTANCPGENWST